MITLFFSRGRVRKPKKKNYLHICYNRGRGGLHPHRDLKSRGGSWGLKKVIRPNLSCLKLSSEGGDYLPVDL